MPIDTGENRNKLQEAVRCIQETMTGQTSKLNAAILYIQQANSALVGMKLDGVDETVRYLLGQLKPVIGPCNTPMWEAPDGRGGQFADPKVALRCWLDRAKGA